jgi:hypothetical protein
MLRQDLSPDLSRSQEGSRVAELEKRLQILEQELAALKRAVDFGSTRGTGLSGSQWLSLGSEAASDSDIDRISDITEHMEWPEEEPEVSPMASMAAFHEDFAPEIVHTKKKPTAEPLVAGTEDSDQNDNEAERKLFWLQLIRDHTSLKSHKKLGIGARLLSAAGPRM